MPRSQLVARFPRQTSNHATRILSSSQTKKEPGGEAGLFVGWLVISSAAEDANGRRALDHVQPERLPVRQVDAIDGTALAAQIQRRGLVAVADLLAHLRLVGRTALVHDRQVDELDLAAA